jgi:hypothetical protein
MKRSEINAIMRSADEFIRERRFYLPPFAHWSLSEWQSRGLEVAEIVESRLGWDITDFGSGDFAKCGLFLFTLRNGRPENWEKLSGKLYAEKIMIVEKDQLTPMHFHWRKMEDIINRGGGRLLLRLYNATPEERLDESKPVQFSADGVQRSVPAGAVIALEPGESITLEAFCYHSFWADERTLVGEVSLVNDDHADNRFFDAPGRFPAIEEDEPPHYLLCTDYARYYAPGLSQVK